MDGEELCRDCLIIGGGPGGYTAALYAARDGLDTVVLDRPFPAGQMVSTNRIENYPGFSEGIDGFTLAKKMRQGAQSFGAGTVSAQALRLERGDGCFRAETDRGVFSGRTLILATGAEPRRLGLAGEDALLGRGVHYCASCDAAFYRGKTVVVAGGGNSAVEDALLLSRTAKRVILLHRRDTLRAEQAQQRKLLLRDNVEYRWNRTVEALLGDGALTGLTVADTRTGARETVPCDALFVSIGRTPQTALVRGLLELDGGGYIPADETTRTAVPGLFAVGDVRAKPLRQIVTAVSDGATAAHFAKDFLSGRPH